MMVVVDRRREAGAPARKPCGVWALHTTGVGQHNGPQLAVVKALVQIVLDALPAVMAEGGQHVEQQAAVAHHRYAGLRAANGPCFVSAPAPEASQEQSKADGSHGCSDGEHT